MLILKANKKNASRIFQLSVKYDIPVIFPTDTIYGIGAPIKSLKANLNIYKIKKREDTKPFPLLIGNIKQLEFLVEKMSIFQREITNKLWPGPYTLIFKADNKLEQLYQLDKKIAVRLPDKQWLREAISTLKSPLTATSVNISGEKHHREIKDIIKLFSNLVTYFLYDPDIKYNINVPSTLIDVSEDRIKFIRNPRKLTEKEIL